LSRIDAESELAGELLDGRYRVRDILSAGSMAHVYLAEDRATEQPIIIKMLSPESETDPELRGRLAREAQAALSIRHPNVVQAIDFGETADGRQYFAMELVPGKPLGELLRRRPLLPLDVTITIVRQAAAVHAAGVVHRDVKPDNMVVLGEPESPLGVKIVDFGMAKLTDANGTSGMNTVVGTAAYMAPEQILVDPVDARTDVYQLGVVLFRLLTGHLPFETESVDVLRHQIFSPVPPPSWLAERIDERLEAIVINATRKEPDNRYPTMADFVADLDVVVGLVDRKVEVRPLRVDPDAYRPRSKQAERAIDVLAKKFGVHARR
jgi:serine/threonine protein kinase